MDEIGYVFSPLDLKILILFILRRLPERSRLNASWRSARRTVWSIILTLPFAWMN